MNQFMIDSVLSAVDKMAKVAPLDAFLIALIGIALVFAVLFVLMAAIWLMGFIMQKTPQLAQKFPKATQNVQKIKNAIALKSVKNNKSAQKALADAAIAQNSEVEFASGTCGELKLINTSERDAALIMAIVADATQTPLNELRFKSIKNVDEGEDK